MTARFQVQWDVPSDPEAFERHYREVHVPLSLALPGLRRYTVSRSVTALRGAGPAYLIAELDWDDLASLRAAFDSEAGRAASADAELLMGWADVRSLIYELEALAPDGVHHHASAAG